MKARTLAPATSVMCVLLLAAPCAAQAAAPAWMPVDGPMARREGAVLFFAPDLERILLVGRADGTPFIQAFDPAAQAWGEVSKAAPPVEQFHPYYQAAYDPGSKTVYCLSGGSVLYQYRIGDKAWQAAAPAPELDGLSWHALACDPEAKKLVVVGADKKADNLGWSRTVVYDIPTGRWTRLAPADPQTVQTHQQLVALKEAVIDLGGHIRLAWYTDPKGIGSEAELADLAARCESIKKLKQAGPFAADVDAVATLLAEKKTLDALKAARRAQRKIEESAEAQWPVPCSRRNSPLAYDARNKVFVLFGGDHEDYLMSDTWTLDLAAGAWKRMKPERAPSPRAGHALFALPTGGGVAMYEGYLQATSTDYSAAPYRPADPIELWRYDPKADRWDLLGHWSHPAKKDTDRLPPVGHFYGYASQYYSPPAVAADAKDQIILAAMPGDVWYLPWKDFPARTWTLRLEPTRPDAEGAAKLGRAPNVRRYRSEMFRAEFCEALDKPKDLGLDKLPENRWVRLPGPPRNPCYGCRQRDWGTAVWDSDRDQVLHWGGGHCVRSASTVAHWSPASGRIVEGFDADEPYGANGGGGFDSSVLNRPWVSTHNYNHYAYDPKCRLLVSARGYLYDPGRMDWLRIEPVPTPFQFEWGNTVVETSPHGAVAWARRKGSESFGLWLFDRQQGWVDLKPKGPLFGPYCDANGMVYDSKRDRMLLSGVGGGYDKESSGRLLAFDFKTRELTTLTPANLELAKTRNAREMAYAEHADWVLIGDVYRPAGAKTGKLYTRVYDCANNKSFLLDAGGFGEDRETGWIGYSTGWMYDARRKLVYVFSYRGEAWAMKVNPQTATPLERPPG